MLKTTTYFLQLTCLVLYVFIRLRFFWCGRHGDSAGNREKVIQIPFCYKYTFQFFLLTWPCHVGFKVLNVNYAVSCWSIQSFMTMTLRNSVIRFFPLYFFTKELFLVPMDMPRKDFEFGRFFYGIFKIASCFHHQGDNKHAYVTSTRESPRNRLPHFDEQALIFSGTVFVACSTWVT
jgi:hypothetical protein